jgi:group I intron endonuclease
VNKNIFYVYTHTDPRTQLVRYVGKGKGRRAWEFKRRCAHHKNWISRLASEGLTPLVKLVETEKTEETAFQLEKLWIAAYRHAGMPLTNLTDGGDGPSGWVPSDETKRRMSHAHKGKTLSEETRRKMSEARRKMSEANRGEKHPRYGKAHSEETKKKLSEVMKGEKHPMFGKSFSEEHKKNLSEAKKGEKHPNFGKPSLRRRAVVGTNLLTGEEHTFESITDAARFINGSLGNVWSCCSGRAPQCKGFSFRYAEK